MVANLYFYVIPMAFKRSSVRSRSAPSLLFKHFDCLMTLSDLKVSGLLSGRVLIEVCELVDAGYSLRIWM